MLRLDFDRVHASLPEEVVKELHNESVETVETAGDGACAIHYVW